jgi:cytoskeletal protein CcmA (bactofilin family)
MRSNKGKQTAPDASTAFINEGSELSGTYSFNGTVVINGRIKGDLHASGTVIVERAGHLEARVYAPVVIVDGEVTGHIVASERIELLEHARVEGDLQTAVLVIEEGAVFEGQTKSILADRADERSVRALELEQAAGDLTATFAAAGG